MKQKAIIGFNGGCCSAYAGEIFSSYKESANGQSKNKAKLIYFRILAGITKSHKFVIYNLDQNMIWSTKELIGNIPLQMKNLPLDLDWTRPSSVKYFESETEAFNTLTNHLANTRNENIRQQIFTEDSLLSVFLLSKS